VGVYRGGYRQYEGPFLAIRTRFLVIFASEFKRLWKGKWNRRLMLFAAIPLIVTVAVLVGKGVVESQVGALPFELNLLGRMLQVEMLFMALLAASAGSGILADDRASNALVLYLARPLTPARYLIGKGLALAGILATVYLVPAFLFIVAAAVVLPSTTIAGVATDLGLATAGCMLNISFVTLVILLFSSLGARARYIGLGWFGLFFFSQMIAKGAYQATDLPWTKLLSMPDLFQKSLDWFLLGGSGDGIAVVILAALATLAGAALWQRVIYRQASKAVA
jgi:ABC-type transport system involved in multi-copper enzyme maturation permease subunit